MQITVQQSETGSAGCRFRLPK